jgi:hypothetical protein
VRLSTFVVAVLEAMIRQRSTLAEVDFDRTTKIATWYEPIRARLPL